MAGDGAETWSRFRGPNGSGRVTGSGYPVEFGRGRNMVWRRPFPPGKSSPVLTADRLYLTAADNNRLTVLSVDRGTGRTIWERSITPLGNQFRHPLNHAASPSAVTDGSNVYACFADFGLVSYDAKGRERWRAPVEGVPNLWGAGASPILAEGAVVVVCDGFTGSFVAAFDWNSGREIWRMDRGAFRLNHATPFLRQRSNRCEIVVTAPNEMAAYDPRTGAKLWSEKLPPGSLISSPVATNGGSVITMMYSAEARPAFPDPNGDGVVSAGEFPTDPKEWQQLRTLQLIAGEVGDKDGAITIAEWDAFWRPLMGTPVLASTPMPSDGGSPTGSRWSYTRGVSRVPTPLVHEGIMYSVNNGGILTALRAETGEVLKAGRLEGGLDNYYASPVAASEQIYLVSEPGTVVVVRAGEDWQVLASNNLDEPCYATPALSGGRIYLRTSQALYCFGSG